MTNWEPTPEQIDAAGEEIYGSGWEELSDASWFSDQISAALTAAHNAAPEPDTTEFEAALHRLVSRAIAYGRGTAEHDAVDVPFQRLIDMYKERR